VQAALRCWGWGSPAAGTDALHLARHAPALSLSHGNRGHGWKVEAGLS